MNATDRRPGLLESLKSSWDTSTGKAIILANLTPVLGLLFLDWTVFTLVFLYWFENVVIGVFQVLRMLLAQPVAVPGQVFVDRHDGSAPQQVAIPAAMGDLLKVFLIPFFCVHYGIFTYVHGIFVMNFFGGAVGARGPAHFHAPPNVGFAAAAIVVSHAYLLVKDYWLGGEYRSAVLPKLMMEPYARVVALHVFILSTAFLVMAFRLPANVLLLLIAAKTAWDCWHDARRRTTIPAPLPVAPAEAA